MTFVKLPSGTIISIPAIRAFESNVKGPANFPDGESQHRGYVTFDNGDNALVLRDADARALSAYLDTQAVAIAEDGTAIVTPENAQVTPPEPYPAELMDDLTRLENMRLCDVAIGNDGTELAGMVPDGFDHLKLLFIRGFAILNPQEKMHIIITDAGRAELARITAQGEV